MFGGGGGLFGGMAHHGRRRQRGEDTVHPLKVSLEDMYNGKTAKLQLSRNIICKTCNGQGGKTGAVRQCRGCSGRGIKITINQFGRGMVQQMQTVCPDCQGEGEFPFEVSRPDSFPSPAMVESRELLGLHWLTVLISVPQRFRPTKYIG